MIGKSVGGYTVVRLLGQGGMGEVYEAVNRRIERKAALKVLRPELCATPASLNRFFAEARAAARIDHPAIVEILDCDVLPEGKAFILMQYLEGETLAAHVASHRALGDPSQAARIGAQIAEGMQAAHDAGIIHRDLKPDNVFLLPSRRGAPPQVKILDFGIAKLTEGGANVLETQTGVLLGTPVYMSPEQCRGSRELDARTDIYSLGCILFEMLSGQRVYPYALTGELIAAHVREPAPDLASLAPAVPRAFAAFVQSMLSKDPAQRPRTMADVARALHAWTEPLPSAPHVPLPSPVGQTVRLITPASSSRPEHEPAAALPKSAPRKAGLVALAVGAALIAAGVYFQWLRPRADTVRGSSPRARPSPVERVTPNPQPPPPAASTTAPEPPHQEPAPAAAAVGPAAGPAPDQASLTRRDRPRRPRVTPAKSSSPSGRSGAKDRPNAIEDL